MNPIRRLPIVLLAALLAASPMAAAQSGSSASSVSYRGGAAQTGEAAAYFLSDGASAGEGLPNPVDPPAAPGELTILGIEIKAAYLEALTIERHFLVLPGELGRQADPRHDPAPAPERVGLEHARASLVEQQSSFQINVLPVDGGIVPFTARSEAGRFEPFDGLALGPGKFREPLSVDTEGERDPSFDDFWSVLIDQPLVVNTDEGADQDLTFTGDLVLEVLGVTLEAVGRGGDGATLESGEWMTEAAAGVQEMRRAFTRIYLTDATLRLMVQGGSPDLYFAAPDVASEQAGESILLGFSGQLFRDGQDQQLSGDRVLLPPGHTLGLHAGPDRLGVDVEPTAVAAGLAPAGATDGRTWVAVAAVLALAVAVGIGLARRLAGPADLRSIEAAIEAQRFGRAARIARRVLRISPGLEDAMLGRAIALSKAGRAGAAISELHAHLARRPASDGSLHYVLGLAFLDVGRFDDARAALDEAVRLTPALAGDVAARLSPSPVASSQVPSVREVHGYA